MNKWEIDQEKTSSKDNQIRDKKIWVMDDS